ncbi:hypothetical protein IAU60_000982 [Kwoniella sp. DSM 27419]
MSSTTSPRPSAAMTPSASALRTTKINATGAAVISGLTLVAATYLFISLIRQGRGKLRVRLLIGMVLSDLILGLIAFPIEIAYLAGHPLKAGTRSCDATGFLLTSVLFSQHLWTMAIAIATFLLLVSFDRRSPLLIHQIYPLSRVTSWMERYSWSAPMVIWAISVLHSGIWHATVGWSTTGSLCYYATSDTGLDRDLMQFIPRAFVFIAICVLYTRLFRFLRRPDTIQLSTQFMAGTQTDPNADHQMPTLATSKILRPLTRIGRRQSGQPPKEPANPEAPWEALEFVHVGGINPLRSFSAAETFQPHVPNGILLASRPVSPDLISPRTELRDPFESTPRTRKASASSELSGPPSQRPSATDTLVTPELHYNPELQAPPSVDSTTRLITPDSIPTIRQQHVLSPVLSQGSKVDLEDEDSLMSRLGVEYSEDGSSVDRRPSGQTLKEFFQEYQVGGEDVGTRERGSASESRGQPQMSAAAYFNRQASLLMLYFPLAYMVVFSVSLVRLVYDMVHGVPNSVLSIMSSWFVLSVGLIDGLVYGIAEFMVKAKVRRKMPEHI